MCSMEYEVLPELDYDAASEMLKKLNMLNVV